LNFEVRNLDLPAGMVGDFEIIDFDNKSDKVIFESIEIKLLVE